MAFNNFYTGVNVDHPHRHHRRRSRRRQSLTKHIEIQRQGIITALKNNCLLYAFLDVINQFWPRLS